MEQGNDEPSTDIEIIDATPEEARAMKALKVTGRALVVASAWTGRHIVTGSVWVGEQMINAYKAIDPDVHRHLMQLPLFTYSLLTKRQVEPEAGPDDGHNPLIFVHGLAGNRGTFQLIAWYFALVGRKRSYRVGFDGGLNVEQQAQALTEFIEEVLKVNEVAQVDLVAHSMGGLICRLALAKHGLAGKVGTLVTMGTPHQGTYPARYANTELTRALRPDSSFIRRLNETPPPPDTRFVCLWSRNDLFVLPPESGILPGSESVEVTPMTHYSYLLDPEAWNAVRRGLEGLSAN